MILNEHISHVQNILFISSECPFHTRGCGKNISNIQCSLANVNSVKAKFRITRILATSPCIAPIKTCTIKVLLSRIPLTRNSA